MRIFLTGFMGSGKSYLGKLLATRLGFGFVDLDDLIEARMGMPIFQIFEQLGEPAFRKAEAECLRSLAVRGQIVVATGGGTPCFFENLNWMNENGVTIYLATSPLVLAQRLLSEKAKRPLLAHLQDNALKNFIEGKLTERREFYERCHLQFDVPAAGDAGIEQLSNYLGRIIK